jgi:hypothetical protein
MRSDFRFELASTLVLPPHLNFLSNKLMVPIVEETKIDNEAVTKLEKGLTHTWIAIMIKVKITDPVSKLDKTSS